MALSATGTDLKWYSDANLQTMVGSGSPLNVNVPAGSTVVRYVTQTVNGCESGPATVTASATTVPGAPSAQNADRCDTGNVALTASGANLKWYSDANLQIQVGTGSPLNVNVTAGSSVIRYVTQTVNGCESAPATATATAKTVPGAPSAQNADRCDSGNVALTATGTDLKWYSDATLQTQVGTGSPLNVNVTAGATVTRYVTQTVNGCESASTTVTATAKNGSRRSQRPERRPLRHRQCGPDRDRHGLEVVFGCQPAEPGWNRFALERERDCRHDRHPLRDPDSKRLRKRPNDRDRAAKTVPGAPSAQNAERCDTGNIALTATGTDLKWYSDATLQTQVGTGSPLNVNVTAGTTVTRYVTQTVNGCESPSTTVTAKANSIPGLPAVSPATRCGSGPVTLGATPGANGTVINWYAASVGGAPFTTGTSYTTPSLNDDATYYVSTYNPTTTCESARVPVIATVTPATTGPASLGLYNSCAAASDEAVFSAAGIGGENVTYVWSLDIDGNGTRDFANLAGLAGVNIVNTAGNNGRLPPF